MAIEKITVTFRSELLEGKESKRKYFTILDETQRKLLCFNPSFYDECEVGKGEIEIEVTPGKSADDTPRFDKPGAKPSTSPLKERRPYGKSDAELLQVRQLAEAQNRSIQAQTALNRAVDLAIASMTAHNKEGISLELLREMTLHNYQLLQSLTQISEVEVIYAETQRDKDTKKTEELPHREARQPSGERLGGEPDTTIPKTAGELFEYAISHGKEFVPSWVRATAKIKDALLTEDMVKMAYQIIKQDQGWTD